MAEADIKARDERGTSAKYAEQCLHLEISSGKFNWTNHLASKASMAASNHLKFKSKSIKKKSVMNTRLTKTPDVLIITSKHSKRKNDEKKAFDPQSLE